MNLRTALLAGFVCLFCQTGSGQTPGRILYLNDGSTVQGRIAARTDSVVVVETDYGTLTIRRENILKEEFLPAPSPVEPRVFTLEDGTVIKGRVLDDGVDTIRVRTAFGVMAIPKACLRPEGSPPLPDAKRGRTEGPVIPGSSSPATPAGAAPERFPIAKGAVWLGGAASLSLLTSEGSTVTAVGLAPEVLWFAGGKGFGLGGTLGYVSLSAEKVSTSQVSIGPTIAFAFGSERSSLYPYLSLGVQYTSMSRTYEAYTSGSWREMTDTQSGSIVAFALGLMNRVDRNAGIPVEIGVSFTTLEEGSAMTTFSMSLGLAALLY
ncbi:MAG: hypothetical protein WB626_03440 [Bacteroidota bacterium]